jgi:hypothetical protein
MRKIKFRAWDGLRMVSGGISFNSSTGELAARLHGVDGNERVMPLMQYTGLTDKNGVEIYEGDIIEFTQTLFNVLPSNFPKKRAEVRWDQYRAGFDVDITTAGRINIEVIGNIHQNPELMELNK